MNFEVLESGTFRGKQTLQTAPISTLHFEKAQNVSLSLQKQSYIGNIFK
ncbi:hypothetical protein [uncultured Fibrobacter sp.]|nr:hypothetical protein [uncultured Fibrobacter sp.]